MAAVLVLTDVFGAGGGAGAVARTVAEALAVRHQVRVLTADAPADLKPTDYHLGVHAVRISPRARLTLGVRHAAALAVLAAELRDHRPDVAFAHNIHSAWSYASLSLLADQGIRTVLTYHDVVAFTPYTKLCRLAYHRQGNGYAFAYRFPWWRQVRAAKFAYRPWRNAAVRQHLARASVRVAVSQALADALRANRVPVDAVVRNGRDLVNLNGQPVSPPTIFFGGRISTSKGMLQLIPYLVQLRQAHQLTPNVRVVGEPGAATAKLRAAAQAAGVLNQFEFLGWQPAGAYLQQIANCRLLLAPSLCFDSLPTVVLDAMAVGRPAVGSIFGGAGELIVDGETGYVVDPFDVPAVAERLANLLTDAGHAAALGAAGHARLTQEFSTARMIQQYEQLAGVENGQPRSSP